MVDGPASGTSGCALVRGERDVLAAAGAFFSFADFVVIDDCMLEVVHRYDISVRRDVM